MSFDFSRMLTDEEAKKIYTRLLKKEENVIDVAKRLEISVDEVYGLIDSCWKETVKEIKEVA